MALRAEYEADCVLRAATADQDGRAAASALSGPSAAAAWSAAPASDLPEQAPADVENILQLFRQLCLPAEDAPKIRLNM